MKGRIKVTSKQRREIDVDRFVFALLRVLEQQQKAERVALSPRSVKAPKSSARGESAA